MIKVSVIVPCYNVADHIRRCLDSLLNQTLRDIEIICIDDKSTDDTLQILRKYTSIHNQIKLIECHENCGVAVARNMGLQQACGEYIGFVDPDDYVDSDFYECLYLHAKQFDKNVVKARVKTINLLTGETVVKQDWQKPQEHSSFFSSQFWSAIYKAEFLKKNNITFPDNIITGQDMVFLADVTLKEKNIDCIQDTYYHYFYQRNGSLDGIIVTHSKYESRYNAFKMILSKIQKENLNPQDLKKYLFSHVVTHVVYNIQDKIYECIKDQHSLFLFLSKLDREYIDLNLLETVFSNKAIRSLRKHRFRSFLNAILPRYRYYLFGIIPVIKIQKNANKIYVSLFEYIPLLKIVDNQKFYLFNSVLILKRR